MKNLPGKFTLSNSANDDIRGLVLRFHFAAMASQHNAECGTLRHESLCAKRWLSRVAFRAAIGAEKREENE
jgi:hypothetical protein